MFLKTRRKAIADSLGESKQTNKQRNTHTHTNKGTLQGTSLSVLLPPTCIYCSPVQATGNTCKGSLRKVVSLGLKYFLYDFGHNSSLLLAFQYYLRVNLHAYTSQWGTTTIRRWKSKFLIPAVKGEHPKSDRLLCTYFSFRYRTICPRDPYFGESGHHKFPPYPSVQIIFLSPHFHHSSEKISFSYTSEVQQGLCHQQKTWLCKCY